MAEVIGIDLGTTNSCIAVLDGRKPQIIPNMEGLVTTPSVVSFFPGEQDPLVGHLALRQATANPENTVFAVKRLMGKKFISEEVNAVKAVVPYGLAQAEDGGVLITAGENQLSPHEVSSWILRYLKKSAEAFLSTDVKDAVVTVPAHFNDHQRQATKEAAEMAGLHVIRMINEPTAASLAYGLENRGNSRLAVYDMGGGTFDVTILELNRGIFHVLATNGDTYLGGEDFDRRIVQWLLSECRREGGPDLAQNKLAFMRFKEAAERAKKELSTETESEINLPFIYSDLTGSKHFQRILTRDILESLTKDLVERSIPYLERAMSDADLGNEQIDEVLLVGGQTKMPMIRQRIEKYFGRSPDKKLNPDEVVAMGAAVQSGILTGSTSNLIVLLDVTPLSLGIETENDQFEKIIDKNTTIPAKETKRFTTVEHNQRRVRIHVLQGESEKASENTSLAVFNLGGIEQAPAGVPDIEVNFAIDADGIVRVSAMDEGTGKAQSVTITPSYGLTREEVNDILKNNQTKGNESPASNE